MKKFHIRSMMLGIGIGVILTSVISIIYLAGSDPTQNLSREEVIDLAKKYGIVEDTPTPTPTPTSVEPTPSTADKETQATPEATPTPEPQEVTFTVKKGDISETVAARLEEAGLVESKEEFEKVISEMKLASKIQFGDYKIKKGTDMRTIVTIITQMEP